MKSRSEIKSKSERKKWVDKLTGKELANKKYLEIRFFIDGKEVSKTKTVYELFHKHKPNFNLYEVHSILLSTATNHD